MDPRVIVNEGKLIIGSVRAVGSNQANVSDPRSGNVEVSVYDIENGTTKTVVLHPHLEQDDHNAPAFFVRPDGRYLAVYSKHAKERRMYYRISEPHNPLAWGPALRCRDAGRRRGVGRQQRHLRESVPHARTAASTTSFERSTTIRTTCSRTTMGRRGSTADAGSTARAATVRI